MKNISQILNLILALALVVTAFSLNLQIQKGDSADSLNGISALEVIMTRSSIRSFTDQPVEEHKIDKMLQAAMAAPTAGNKQPWAFVVIKDSVKLKQFADTLPHAKMAAKASLAIAVCGDPSKGYPGVASEYWVQDASAATQNLLLAAHSLGLGAVWTGVYPIADRVEFVQQTLSLPDSIIPLNIIPIGYFDVAPNIKDKYKKENIHWEKW